MTFRNPITLIAAMGQDRTIGLNNTMPWHLPEDLRHFKARTLGKVMIMGRNTFNSIGHPLPGRTTIIVSRTLTSPPHADCHLAASIEQALHMAQELCIAEQEIIIAGGGEIYAQTLPLAQRMILTQIQKNFDGDTFFPQWSHQEWQLIAQEQHQQPQEPYLDYSFLEYQRKV